MPEKIRDPVPREEIASELTPSNRIREFRGVNIHLVTAARAPAVMQEIGRVRETEFRAEGGGTGRAADIDEFDTGPNPFSQLVAWDSDNGELIGMYRLARLDRLTGAEGIGSPSARLFEFSDRFCRDYAPFTVELGRSVVNRTSRRAVMGLFCVWAGLGAVVAEHPDIRYFFGKVTMYPGYDPLARSAIYRFLNQVCPDREGLMRPAQQTEVTSDGTCDLDFDRHQPDKSFQQLKDFVRARGELLPPLLISYLELSQTMMSFGTARNDNFGGVEETAILVTIADIRDRQRSRFIASYSNETGSAVSI